MAVADRPDVSVIIPVLDAEESLPAAIDSALQNDCSVEVLVIDDGSRDESRRVAIEHPGAVSVHSTGSRMSGPSNARNIGIERASGEWIAILDADDRFRPHRLDTLLQAARDLGTNVLIDDVEEIGLPASDSASLFERRGLASVPRVLSARGVVHFDLGLAKPMVRTSALHTGRIQYRARGRATEDFAFLLECALQFGGVGLVPERLYVYQRRPQSVSAPTPAFWLDSASVAVEMLKSYGESDVMLAGLLRRRIGASLDRYDYLSAKDDFARTRSPKAIRHLLAQRHFYERLMQRAWSFTPRAKDHRLNQSVRTSVVQD